MIFINLSTDIYTDEQIARIFLESDNGELNPFALWRLLWYESAVIPAESGVKAVRAKDIAGRETDALWGAQAVKAYLEGCGIEDIPDPLMAVEIPAEVCDECSCPEWAEISKKLAVVEAASDAFAYCCEMGAPMTLVIKRARRIKSAVEALAGMRPFSKERKEEIGATLSDVGWSLTNGWSKEKREQFAREYEEFCRETDGQMTEELNHMKEMED